MVRLSEVGLEIVILVVNFLPCPLIIIGYPNESKSFSTPFQGVIPINFFMWLIGGENIKLPRSWIFHLILAIRFGSIALFLKEICVNYYSLNFYRLGMPMRYCPLPASTPALAHTNTARRFVEPTILTRSKGVLGNSKIIMGKLRVSTLCDETSDACFCLAHLTRIK